jgi:hypothetical protein
MSDLSGDISSLIFRQIIRHQRKDISLNHRLLDLFLELDGKKSLGTIARKKGLSMVQMRSLVEQLLELDLIEPAQTGPAVVDGDFIRHLVTAFSNAIGPIANVIIEDEIEAMGYTIERFPSVHAAELVDLLAHEIKRPEKRTVFQTDMLRKIQEKKY